MLSDVSFVASADKSWSCPSYTAVASFERNYFTMNALLSILDLIRFFFVCKIIYSEWEVLFLISLIDSHAMMSTAVRIVEQEESNSQNKIGR